MSHSRRPFIAGNWKMNGLKSDATELVKTLVGLHSNNNPDCDMAVCPPFTLLDHIRQQLQGSAIELGAQDCHFAPSGAHTGDISAAMLKDAGCSFVIVGHSERRADHHENDQLIKDKALAALGAGLKVILCIGETEAERDQGKALEVVRAQLSGGLPDNGHADNLVIAYEPVWAIGTGRTPTLDEVEDVHQAVREKLGQLTDPETAAATRILYGGSMKPGNARDLLALKNVDGGLIGGASLKAEDFMAIAACCG